MFLLSEIGTAGQASSGTRRYDKKMEGKKIGALREDVGNAPDVLVIHLLPRFPMVRRLRADRKSKDRVHP
jgi:hypothetical protein